MRLVLLGPPGVGKGTQADILAKKLDIPTISTGDIFRDAVKRNTSVGQVAASYMEVGELVPDDLVIGVVIERISKGDCENGYILDGVPRTLNQADSLEHYGIGVDAVLSIEMPDEAIEERLGGRRACAECSATYHIKANPPKSSGICDVCGGELIIRQDDEPNTVKNRLLAFHRQTEPLKSYYRARNKLKTVANIPGVEATNAAICTVLGI